MSTFTEFTLNLETFIADLNRLIEENYRIIDELLTLPNKTYANFVRPFDFMEEVV